MKLKRFLSCLLTLVLVCSTMLTGCSKDGSMFSDMKDIARIKAYEFTAQGSIALKSEDEDGIPIDIGFAMDGKTDGKSASANMSITWGALTYTLNDFIRMTDNTLYINLSSLLSSLSSYMGSSTAIPGIKSWVSIPVTEPNEESQKLSLTFYDAIIDSFEKICKDQKIRQTGDTWTLDLSGEQMVSFLQAALEEINTNFSSWYDSYVTLLEKSGNTELLKDYSDLFGDYSDLSDESDEEPKDESDKKAKEETDDKSDEESTDPIQALKDGKEEALKEWAESYTTYKEAINDLAASISSGETKLSAKYDVSLSGKEGSQNAEQTVEFTLEDTKEASSANITANQKLTEISEVTVEAPAADDVMAFEEFSELMSSFMDLSGLLGDLEDDEESSLSEDEMKAITSSLKENQAYLYNSASETLKPYVLTFDQDLYTTDSNIGDYNMDLWIKGAESSYASVAYEQGKFSDDIAYYLEDGQKTSTMSTDIGDISYYTATKLDEWDCYTTTFGIQLDEESYFIGILELEKDAKLDAEACLKSLLKELKPYEGNSSSSV